MFFSDIYTYATSASSSTGQATKPQSERRQKRPRHENSKDGKNLTVVSEKRIQGDPNMLLDKLTPKDQVISVFVMIFSQLKVVLDRIVVISILLRFLNMLGSD